MPPCGDPHQTSIIRAAAVEADGCIQACFLSQHRVISCTNTMSSPFFSFSRFPLNYCGIFLIIHRGGQSHFPRIALSALSAQTHTHTHCFILFLHECVPEMKARQHKPLNNELKEALKVCVNLEGLFIRVQHSDGMFPKMCSANGSVDEEEVWPGHNRGRLTPVFKKC